MTGLNLEGVSFQNIHATKLNLSRSNVSHLKFHDAEMEYAILVYATLRNADFNGANLRFARFDNADLRHADLVYANLEKVNLTGANLKGAKFANTDLRGAILPDESRWTPETDMGRFTDLGHDDFWSADEE